MEIEYRTRWRAVRAAALSLAALALVGCGDTPDIPVPARGGPASPEGRPILRVAYDREIEGLNPLTSRGPADISSTMMEGLVTLDETNTYVPVLAREIPTVANGGIVMRDDGTVDMTWTLQEGVTWHDGERFTSEDVCFTWRFAVSPGSRVHNRDQYLGIVDCLTPDDTTVVLRWDGLYGYSTGLFEAVLPAHVLGDMSAEEIVGHTPFNRGDAFVGTGPFRFGEWTAGESIRVVRNNAYWRGPQYPAVDQIVFSFIPNSSDRLELAIMGEQHWARLFPTQAEVAARVGGFQVHIPEARAVVSLDFSVATEQGQLFFEDPTVRGAIFQAIDRSTLVDPLFGGSVDLAHTPVPPSNAYHNPAVPAVEYHRYTAEGLMDAAVWIDGVDGVRRLHGQRMSINLLLHAGDAEEASLALVLRMQLGRVGVEMTTESADREAWAERWQASDWEAVIGTWIAPPEPSLTTLFGCDGGSNRTGFCDPELDAVLASSDRSEDPAGRRAAMNEAQLRIAEASRSLPLFYAAFPELVSDRIGNYRGGGTAFGSFWNVWEWTLD